MVKSFMTKETDNRFVLIGGTLIDGEGGDPIRDAVVTVAGSRIEFAGPRDSVNIPSDARIVDVTGKFILPGLIDVHVHYQGWMGELFLAHGVTTVKDMGNDVEWISRVAGEIDGGETSGPRIVYVGNGLDAPPPFREHHVGLGSADAARRAVRLLAEHGASAIKVREKITPGLLEAVCEAAHELGIPVTGHLGHTNAREAAVAGIDGLEHATGVVEATAEHSKPAEPGLNDVQQFIAELKAFALIDLEKAEDLIGLLVERDVALIPTMSTWWRMASHRREQFAVEDAEYTRIPQLRYLPDFIRQFLATSFIFNVADADDSRQIAAGYDKIRRVIRRHAELGGRVLAGSDTIYAVPGLSLIRELVVMTDAGFSPMEAIVIGTRDNARFIGRSESLGTIAAGKIADIVVTAADPLEHITNLQSVEMVFKDGCEVDRNYNPDYGISTAAPNLTRPLWLERRLQETA